MIEACFVPLLAAGAFFEVLVSAFVFGLAVEVDGLDAAGLDLVNSSPLSVQDSLS